MIDEMPKDPEIPVTQAEGREMDADEAMFSEFKEFDMTADVHTWMIVLCEIELAIRHPDHPKPQAIVARGFKQRLRAKLKEQGVQLPNDLDDQKFNPNFNT